MRVTQTGQPKSNGNSLAATYSSAKMRYFTLVKFFLGIHLMTKKAIKSTFAMVINARIFYIARLLSEKVIEQESKETKHVKIEKLF